MVDLYSQNFLFELSFGEAFNHIVPKPKQTCMKQKIVVQLSAFILFLALLPFAGTGQTKNVISTHRVFPKIDKIAEFEKAVATHAQKYHTGDNHWRVFAIQSGPDIGGYHITEGPKSWESEDARGDISPEHQNDWNKNVAIYLTDKQSGGYSVYQESLSTIALGDFTDKIQISHVYPKTGRSDDVAAMLKKIKKAWEAAGVTVAVYASSSSGPAQFALTTRYKQGLKERATGFRKPFKEVYETANGEGSYEQYLKDAAEYVQESWSELLFLRKDLSSK